MSTYPRLSISEPPWNDDEQKLDSVSLEYALLKFILTIKMDPVSLFVLQGPRRDRKRPLDVFTMHGNGFSDAQHYVCGSHCYENDCRASLSIRRESNKTHFEMKIESRGKASSFERNKINRLQDGKFLDGITEKL